MRRTKLVLCALLVTTTFGCDRVRKPVATLKDELTTLKDEVATQITALVGRFRKKPPTPVPMHLVRHPQAPTPAAPAPPAPPKPVAAAPARTTHDVPYVSQDTGTLTPGMSERDVYSLWGAPIAVRHAGEYTYLFFRNGCEHRCGTEDVVTLDNGQVVNAVVRWPGHNFLGAPPAATPPPPPLAPAGPRGATDSLPVKGTVPGAPDSARAPGGMR